MYAITVARTATLCKSSKARESVCVSVFVCVCAFVCVCICVRVRVQHKNRAKQGAANARDLGECRVVSAVLVVCKGRAGAENGAPAQRGALQRESRQASQRVRKGRDEGEGGRRLSPPPHTHTNTRTHARTHLEKEGSHTEDEHKHVCHCNNEQKQQHTRTQEQQTWKGAVNYWHAPWLPATTACNSPSCDG